MALETYYQRLAELQAEKREDRLAAEAEGGQLRPLVDLDKDNPLQAAPINFNVGTEDKGALKTLFGALKFTMDHLGRATQVTREAVLFGRGKFTFDAWRKRTGLALDGKLRMSRDEFTELLVGKETFDRMKATPIVPGWMLAAVTPEWLVSDKRAGKGISAGDMFSFGADMVVDPFTLLAFTPVKVGKFVTKPATIAFRPLVRGLDRMFGPRSENPLAYLFNQGRQMEDVMTGPQKVVFEDLEIAKTATQKRLFELSERAERVGRPLLKMGEDSNRKIGVWLSGLKVSGIKGAKEIATEASGKVRLNADEQRIADGFKEIIEERIKLHKELGHLNPKGDPRQLELFPKENAPLEDFFPFLAGKDFIPSDIWQSWSIEDLGRIHLRLRKPGEKLAVVRRARRGKGRGGQVKPVEAVEVTPRLEQFSGIDAVKDFLYASVRKTDMEPTLLKYAPNVKGRKFENPVTASMSRVQRRYITDIINQFTGKGRGRKQIEFDLMVGEFWQKLGDTPVFNRVSKLFRRLNGSVGTIGMPDFSTTSKLTGMMAHNIIRSTLGLNLRSALVNMTQVANFGVARGMPALFRGMLKMTDPNFRKIRKMTDLNTDFRAMWADDIWVGRLGRTWDKILMGPFNVAENFIRGTGYNIGIDVWGKKNGLKNLGQIIEAGRLEEAMRFARFESLNGAFIYGTLGRPPVLANPLLRPFTALLSFPFKQAEFYRRTFVKDGGAFMRFVGLHGFLIEKANEEAGIAAEEFLGWGFTPMARGFSGLSLFETPAMQALRDVTQGLNAVAEGNQALAERKFEALVGGKPDEVRRDPTLLLRGSLGTSFGINPAPWLALKSLDQLIERWQTKRQEIGEGSVPIADTEIVTNFLIGRSTTQKMRGDLRRRRQKAVKKIDFELDTRVRKFLVAADGDDGDALGAAAWGLAQPIEIEGQNFYPAPGMVETRMNNQLEKKFVSQDLLDMRDNQFLMRVYMQAHLALLERVGEGR